MGQWIDKTFGDVTLKVWRTSDEGDQAIYAATSTWNSGTRITDANKEQFRAAANAYLTYIHDKDLTHQLFTKCPNGMTHTINNRYGTPIARVSFTNPNGMNMVYVTHEWDRNFETTNYSLSSYVPYTGQHTCGIKFRCIMVGNDPDSTTTAQFKVERINGAYATADIRSSAIYIDDIVWNGSQSSDAYPPNIPGYSGWTYGGASLLGHIDPPFAFMEYKSGDTDKLVLSQEDPISTVEWLPRNAFYCYSGVGIDISDEGSQEDGYVNELLNRFSPRGFAQNIGMYLIFADGTASDQGSNNIKNYMKDLMYTDITDLLDKGFFGSDGKEYILGIRWYYGLNQNLSLFEFERAVRIGTKHLNKFDNITEFRTTPELAKEFTIWETSELQVMPYFDNGDGNYLDMLSHYQLYLPYYGFMDIDPNDILGGTIKVIYNINIVTGAANIHVICKTARTGNNAVKCYDVNTQIGEDIPYGTDLMEDTLTCFSRVIQSGAKAGMAALSTAGALQASAGETMLTNLNNFNQANPGVMQQNGIDVEQARSDIQGKINRGNIVHSIADKIEQANTPAPIRSSMSGGEGGCLDELYPYLLISRPMARDPQGNREEVLGMPSYAVANLGSVTGFTQIAAVMPNSLTNAPKYINEIIALLQAGVYL